MSTRHRYLPLSKIDVGMVLADDLLDKLGHILLPAGVTLTEGMLKSIAHHDIHQLSVLVETPETEVIIDPQQRMMRLEKIFSHCRDAEPGHTLFMYMKSYRLKVTE